MSAGAVAGLIAAGAFVVLVVVVAVPLLKLGRMIDAGTRRVEQSARIIDTAVDRLQQTSATVDAVNANLVHVEKVASNVESISSNVNALTSVFSATLGGPLIKMAAFSYGVRRAVGERQRSEVESTVKAELKARKKKAA